MKASTLFILQVLVSVAVIAAVVSWTCIEGHAFVTQELILNVLK